MRGRWGKWRKPAYKLIPAEKRREEVPLSYARIVPAPVCHHENADSTLNTNPKMSAVDKKNTPSGKFYEQRPSSAQISRIAHEHRAAASTHAIALPNNTRRNAYRTSAKKPAHTGNINDSTSRRFDSSGKRKKTHRKRRHLLISVIAGILALILLGIILIPGVLHMDSSAPQLLTIPYVLSDEDDAYIANSPDESKTLMSAVLPTPEKNVMTALPTPGDSSSPSPSAQSTATSSPIATSESTSVPTAASTPKPTIISTPSPTAVPTPSPTAVPTPTPTTAPTPSPTTVPTPTPTTAPTPSPTAAPMPTPTAAPTPSPTKTPVATPEPTTTPLS